jgi:hypothetical protein
MNRSIAEFSEEEQAALYHLGLNSLTLEEYLALKDKGDVESGGQSPTLETFVMLVNKGRRIAQEGKG